MSWSASRFILRDTEAKCVVNEWYFGKVKGHQSEGPSSMAESPENPATGFHNKLQACLHLALGRRRSLTICRPLQMRRGGVWFSSEGCKDRAKPSERELVAAGEVRVWNV